MGLPVVLSADLHAPGRYKSVFYAHEVAVVRRLVEYNGGHDTRFYNALRLGLAQGHSLDAVFGDQAGFFKHAMVQRAGICDGMFAVGDLVIDELRFLGGVVGSKPVELVYNGVPAASIDMARKLASRELMLQYAQNLVGYRPDYVFTHVGRLVVSKALWRDLRVLEHMDRLLAAQGKNAIFFIVATGDPMGRLPFDVHRWEHEYGWPVGHRADNGDLRGDEDAFFFHAIEPFHWGHHNVRVLLVNQFGWSRERCGDRMPEAMTFADLRIGTDVEFGQSIYEPFGIAQVEPLGAGALCVVSNITGCTGFTRRAAAGQPFGNLIVADYTTLQSNWALWNPWDALWIDKAVRDDLEARNSFHVARQIVDRLPRTQYDMNCLLDAGQAVARRMSWDVVASEYSLPGPEPPPMMDYRAALAYIYGYTNYERKGVPKYRLAAADLDRMRELLARLGDPHRTFASLLIAGTKGKGSTSAFTESMLRAAGYRTALYTSPHLHSFRERIQVERAVDF